MSQVLKNKLPPPETKLEYTKWNQFPGEEELDKREITSQGDEGKFEHLDTP